MKQLINYLLAVAAVALTVPAAASEPLTKLRTLCQSGESIVLTTPTRVEAIVVSDFRSPNMELNPNLNYAKVDLEVNDRTVYIQTPDGSFGLRMLFDEATENRLARYDRVELDLNGCRLTRSATPDCYTLSGVSALHVRSVTPGTASAVPLKERFISELTDEDLYTFVRLRDAEFIFKEGSYTNIWEPYAQITSELHHHKYEINNRMDGWASLVRDSKGGAIYMLINTRCTWRRAGKPIPQGVGPLAGVVVHTPMRRYGGPIGRYSIRPLDEGDIAVSRSRNSPWRRLTGWLLDGTAGNALNFELMGHQSGLTKTDGKRGDRVVSDSGTTRGLLWTDSNSSIFVDADFNALGTENRGWVSNGAIFFSAPTVDWFQWDNIGRIAKSNAFYISFPTKKVKGTELSLSFDIGAGNQDGNFSCNFPIEWKVEYAVEGGAFQPLKHLASGEELFTLRPVPWWDKVIDGSGHSQPLRTSYDCAMGLQQHTFALPAECIGRNEVVVRISPASGVISQIPSNPSANVRMNTLIRKTSRSTTVIRFGTITVDYK